MNFRVLSLDVGQEMRLGVLRDVVFVEDVMESKELDRGVVGGKEEDFLRAGIDDFSELIRSVSNELPIGCFVLSNRQPNDYCNQFVDETIST